MSLDIHSVRTGDEIYVKNMILNVEMGGVVLYLNRCGDGVSAIVINQTPSAYDYLKGTILTSKDYIFIHRKFRFGEVV